MEEKETKRTGEKTREISIFGLSMEVVRTKTKKNGHSDGEILDSIDQAGRNLPAILEHSWKKV